MSSGSDGRVVDYLRRMGWTMKVCSVAAVVLLLALPYSAALFTGNGSPMLIGEPHPDPLLADDSDAYEGCWHFWWTARAISMGVDPRLCTMVYPPDGASMAYQHIGWIDTFMMAVLGTGEERPVLSYDIALLAGTLLAAVFGWLLARAWGLGPVQSLITALMIAWMPARTARVVQHYQLADCWTMLAALWLCRSWLEKGGVPRYAGFTAAVAAASLQSPFLGMFALLGLPVTVWASRGSWRKAAVLSVGALAAAAAGLLMVFTSPGDPGSPAMDPAEAFYWAAEPQSILLPSPFGAPAVLAGMPHRLQWMSNTSEGVIGPGLTVMVLMLLAAVRFRRWRPAVAAMVFYLFCLGPELRLLAHHTGIPLPFRLLQHLPVLEGIRAPSRFALIGGVFAALAAGYALQRLRRGWFAMAAALVLVELFVPVLPLLPTEIPEEVLGLPEGSRVLEVPIEFGARRYSLFQTEGGYLRMYCFLARPPEFPSGRGLEVPGDQADFVVYHRWLMHPEELRRADSIAGEFFVDQDLSLEPVWITGRNEEGAAH